MNYLLMIYGDENAKANAPKEALQAMYGEYAVYTQALDQAGVRLGGEVLQPTATGATVTAKGGEVVKKPGAFAELPEQLGGYYVLSCGSLDEALEWAAKCPGARFGSVEVRPIVDFSRAQ